VAAPKYSKAPADSEVEILWADSGVEILSDPPTWWASGQIRPSRRPRKGAGTAPEPSFGQMLQTLKDDPSSPGSSLASEKKAAPTLDE
jgi:hypothetical protein